MMINLGTVAKPYHYVPQPSLYMLCLCSKLPKTAAFPLDIGLLQQYGMEALPNLLKDRVQRRLLHKIVRLFHCCTVPKIILETQ